ncbi:MAG: HD domain-containing protein [Candidatus Omnitrophota bacterium]|nr:HD domain-containing protein [Candidatus Omnitrophota bacterium]
MRLSNVLKKEEIKRLDFSETASVSLAEFKQPSSAVCSADEIYRELADLMRLVLNKTTKNEPIDIALVRKKIDRLIDGFESNDLNLSRLMDNSGATEDYLIAHSVNVCILSLAVGQGLKYKKEQLEDLGIGAFLHDVGMVKVKKDIIEGNHTLDAAEYEQVQKHAEYGVEILNNVPGINQDILAVVGEHQERADGTGYPRGLTLGKINESARIVGLADVYDALTHSRPYRRKLEPFESAVIQQIVSHRHLFDPYILRVFLESLTKHPAYMLWLTADGIYRVLDEYKSAIKDQRPLGQEKRGFTGKRNLLLAAAVFFALMSAVLISTTIRTKDNKVFYPMGESLYLAKNKLPLKIAYDWTADVSEVRSISLDLRQADLSKYYFLGLSSRVEPALGGPIKNAALRIEIENSRKEKSEYYLKGVSGSWQEFRLPLAYFDKLSDWSEVIRIYFSLEPWNTRVEKGTLYVDGISFYRKE